MDRQDEKHIIEAVLQGDLSEYRILVERYQKPVYSMMLQRTGSVMTAEDLTQDVFTRAYEKLHTFRTGRRFFPWLYTIAVNRCRDHLRREKIQQGLFSEESDGFHSSVPNPNAFANHPDNQMEVHRVTEALQQLPVKYSEPLFLYYREEFSTKEIANTLGISVPAAKVRIHRGRHLLRQMMGVSDEPA